MWQVVVLIIGLAAGGFLLVTAIIYLIKDYPNKQRFYRSCSAAIAFIIIAVAVSRWPTPPPTPLPKRHVHVPTPPPSSGLPMCVPSSITIDGSTALQPLIKDVAHYYMSYCSSAHIVVNGGGSQQGLSDVEGGTVEIGDSDVAAPRDKYPDLNDHVVAAVVYVLIVHQNLGISNLTTEEIKKIFDGTYMNWSQLGHNSLPITAIIREDGSGTRTTFDQYVLRGSEKASLTLYKSTEAVIHAVQTIPGAIGYVSLHDALTHPNNLTIVNIDGHPYSDYFNNGYKFWNLEHMYTKQGTSSNSFSLSNQIVQAFIDYMGNIDIVKQIIKNDSFYTVEDVSAVLDTHYQS